MSKFISWFLSPTAVQSVLKKGIYFDIYVFRMLRKLPHKKRSVNRGLTNLNRKSSSENLFV